MKRRTSYLALLSGMVMSGLILAAPGFSMNSFAAEKANGENAFTSGTTQRTASTANLVEGYMHQQGQDDFPGYTLNTNRRAYLNEINGIVYDAILNKSKEVAAGKEANTKIEVTINIKDILGDRYKEIYYPEDFGLESFTDDAGDSNVFNVLNNYIGFDPEKIIRTLRLDCPYDIYWYGNEYDTTNGFVLYREEGKTTGDFICAKYEEPITFELCVSADYSTSGKGGECNADVNKCKAVKSAADNANKIIQKYKSKSDFEKLKAYRDEICNLTAYNYDYIRNGVNRYGNPHQMINVFDGDPDTKVICEGYSKAFKYLCDGTDFNSNIIECYIVTGNMAEKSPSANKALHMWNNVRMSDGKNYIVDVTNCDPDNNNEQPSNDLFMVGAKKVEGEWLKPAAIDVYYSYEGLSTGSYTQNELAVSETDYDPKSEVAEEVTINFNPNGGKVATESITTYVGGCIEQLPVPTREGHKFIGWYTEPTGGEKIPDAVKFVSKCEDTWYAHWEALSQGEAEYQNQQGNSGEQDGQSQNQQENPGEQGGQNQDQQENPGGQNGQNQRQQDAQNQNQRQNPAKQDNKNNQQNQNNDTNPKANPGAKENVTPQPENGTISAEEGDFETSVDGTASITGSANKKIKSVNIGNEITNGNVTYKVTKIQPKAFKKYKKIKSLTIGDNVQEIGSEAFSGCTGLKKITIHANNLKSVGKKSFKGLKDGVKINVVCREKKTYEKVVKKLKKAGASKAKFKFVKG
ncbi:leucine-rich repeat protein [Butyrivibrio sp. WCE2006]|uniref:leucine-rich repeat protein n=1 Tax=Butyrivibrio sp. WCE2006 TaxID=1410611 RepID=UPI000678B0D9|nr:leucine-rich repeat protein [Butyrivibrio sp. WCE2006]